MIPLIRRVNLLKFLNGRNTSRVASLNYVTDNNNHHRYENRNFNRNIFKYGIIGGVIGVIYLKYESHKAVLLEQAGEATEKFDDIAGTYREDLPTYTLEDVLEHSELEKQVWVTYKRGVYDITNFIDQHPGGEQILMAAGSSLEPFWLLYGIHKTRQVYTLLEGMRIGNISEEVSVSALENMDDPYLNDPKRHKVIKAHAEKPFNGEPPQSLLVENFYTPNEIFYVRNHLPVPDIDPETYELEMEVEGTKRHKVLSLTDIKKLPKHTITATIMCAGNRRSEMNKVKEVKGLGWSGSAIGNAKWSGARLVDVLKSMGIDENTKGYDHVHFEGLDADAANNLYSVSIPFGKAVDKNGDVLLAYEMNGEPIPRDHGFPIRAIVPGTVGARNCKWLGRIIVSKKECESHWQKDDYKGASPSADPSKTDLSKLPSIQELPITSAICQPINGDTIKPKDGFVTVRGYAWSGGGRKIIRVDVTGDGGQNWHVARIDHQEEMESPRHWGWTLWSVDIPVKRRQKSIEICAKAVDSSYNTQPESMLNIWNFRGFLNNAYHKVRINLRD